MNFAVELLARVGVVAYWILFWALLGAIAALQDHDDFPK